MDVRAATGVETYVNDEVGDPNAGIIVDSTENRGRALTSEQARALAIELLQRADYFDTLRPFGVDVLIHTSGGSDDAVVVQIDTQFEPDGSDDGPGLRVLLNDSDAWVGVPYGPIEEDI